MSHAQPRRTYTPQAGSLLADALRALTRTLIIEHLAATQGNRSVTARRLGVSRRTLLYKITELGIDIPPTHGRGRADMAKSDFMLPNRRKFDEVF